MPERLFNVLFLCTHNSARSIDPVIWGRGCPLPQAGCLRNYEATVRSLGVLPIGLTTAQLSLSGTVDSYYRTLELDGLKGNCYSSLMATNSRLASAVHIMSFVAHAADEGTTSEAIAKSLRTNPVVVRKILKLLERKGLVVLRPGRHGGVGLRHPPSRITLGQIYRAVESENGVFAKRSHVHDRCVVACAMKQRLGPIFNAANDAVEQALSKTSLAELVRDVG